MTSRICLSVCLLILGGMGRTGHAADNAPIYDNVHIKVTDPVQAVDWYNKYLGAKTLIAGRTVLIGDVRIVLLKSDNEGPSTGSVIDHIGLSFPSLDAKLKELGAAGIKYQTAPAGTLGSTKTVFVDDPFGGTKIELLQDNDLIGFHHVHLRVADPHATMKWYQEAFGGEIAKVKGVEGLHYGNMWLLAAKNNGETLAPSDGRAIQNIAWRLKDIQAQFAKMKTMQSVKFLNEPQSAKDPGGSLLPVWYMMVEDPNGVKVETLQRPPPSDALSGRGHAGSAP